MDDCYVSMILIGVVVVWCVGFYMGKLVCWLNKKYDDKEE